MALTALITYDVSADDKRAQVASRLQAWGERIQRSVFVCVLGEDELERLCLSLVRLIDPDRDALHVVRLCAECRGQVLSFGQATFEPPPLFWFV